jgi:hypothetical protein
VDTTTILREATLRRGALAPVVGALDLAEVAPSDPPRLLDGPLTGATIETVRNRTIAEFRGTVILRMTTLDEDRVVRGTAAVILSGQRGVS